MNGHGPGRPSSDDSGSGSHCRAGDGRRPQHGRAAAARWAVWLCPREATPDGRPPATQRHPARMVLSTKKRLPRLRPSCWPPRKPRRSQCRQPTRRQRSNRQPRRTDLDPLVNAEPRPPSPGRPRVSTTTPAPCPSARRPAANRWCRSFAAIWSCCCRATPSTAAALWREVATVGGVAGWVQEQFLDYLEADTN